MIRVFVISVILLCIPHSLFSQDSAENHETIPIAIGTGQSDSAQEEEGVNNVFKIFKAKADIDSITTGMMYWKDLVKAGKIDLTGCASCEVMGFDLKIVAYKIFNSDSCSVDPALSGIFHSEDRLFSDKIISAINKAREGRFTFYNISVRTPLGQEMKMNQILLYVYPSKDYYKKRIVKYKD